MVSKMYLKLEISMKYGNVLRNNTYIMNQMSYACK